MVQYARDDDIEWRKIPGFSPNYEVSNMGEVRVVNYNNSGKPRILKQRINHTGYFYIGISTDSGKRVMRTVHRLVALAFIQNPESYPVINHKNEIKTDNRVENLEWCTIKYNVNYGTGIARQRELQKQAFARPEHSKLMSEISRRYWDVAENRQRVSDAKKEEWANMPIAERERRRLAKVGQKRTEASKQLMSERARCRWMREGEEGAMARALKKASLVRQRRVCCLDTGMVFESIIEAAAVTHGSAKCISGCCSANSKPHNKMHKAGGFVWVYTDNNTED